MGHKERGKERELPTLCSSCKRQGSRLPPLPALVYCSRAQQAASAGNAPSPTSPLVAHTTCPLCNIRAIDTAAIEAENEKGKRNGATCHLPPATRHTPWGKLPCSVVALLSVWQLKVRCLICQGGKVARGHGGVAGLIDGPHLPHGSAQAGSSSLPHNEVGTMPQIEAGSYPSPPSPSLSPAWHDKTIEYLWALAEQIMRQGLSCHCELPPPFGRANEMQFGL